MSLFGGTRLFFFLSLWDVLDFVVGFDVHLGYSDMGYYESVNNSFAKLVRGRVRKSAD